MTVPPPPPSSYAQEGTKAHELAEAMVTRWLESGRKWDPNWLNVWQWEYEDTKDDMGRTMADYVYAYLCLCTEHADQFDSPPAVRTEVRLSLDDELQLFGTVDFCATGIKGGEPQGLIVDLKYGRGVPVKASDNPQLAYYACALAQNSKKDLKKVAVAVVQPRLDEWYTTALLSKEELLEWRDTFIKGAKKALKQAKTGDFELKAGEHCRFCPALGSCKAHERYLSEKAGVDFVDEAPEVLADSHHALTTDRIGKILSVRDDVRRFFDAVEKRALDLALSGQEVPGLKVVEGRTQRKWAGSVEDIAAKLRERGMAEPTEMKLKGITEVEKALGRGKVDDLLVKPKGAPTLVTIGDKRPSYQELAGAEFE